MIMTCMSLVPKTIWTNFQIYYLSTCMYDIKDWTIQNKFKLNGDKMEAMVLGKPSIPAGVIVDAVDIAGGQITFSSKVKSLGVTLDPVLSMKQLINSVCKA